MNAAAFFAAVRGSLFGGSLNQPQVEALSAILTAWDHYGDGDPNKLAYVLATAHHETGRFKYTHEIWGPTAAQKRYEGRADLGNTVAGDGKRFMGRGYCQITGRRNYADWAKRLGADLVANPDLVTQPAIAARILVEGAMRGTFTGKKLGDYIGAQVDFKNARRVINGTDKADLIAGYAREYRSAVDAALVDVPEPVAPKPAEPAETTSVGGPLVAALMTKIDDLEKRVASLEAAA